MYGVSKLPVFRPEKKMTETSKCRIFYSRFRDKVCRKIFVVEKCESGDAAKAGLVINSAPFL